MLGLCSTCFGLFYLCHMCHSRCAQGTHVVLHARVRLHVRQQRSSLDPWECFISVYTWWAAFCPPGGSKALQWFLKWIKATLNWWHLLWRHRHASAFSMISFKFWMNECFKLSISFKCVTMKFSQKTLWKSVSISCFCSCEDDLKRKCTCWSWWSLPCLSLLYTRLSRCILLDMVATQICIWCNTFISLKVIQKRHRI